MSTNSDWLKDFVRKFPYKPDQSVEERVGLDIYPLISDERALNELKRRLRAGTSVFHSEPNYSLGIGPNGFMLTALLADDQLPAEGHSQHHKNFTIVKK